MLLLLLLSGTSAASQKGALIFLVHGKLRRDYWPNMLSLHGFGSIGLGIAVDAKLQVRDCG